MSSMKEAPKVVVQIGNREVEMPVEHARKLYAQLRKMFEQQVEARERVHGVRPNAWAAPYYHTQTIPLPEYPVTVQPIWYRK